MSSFGARLREHRRRSTDPADGKRLTQARLAELLEAEPGAGQYTGATLSHWENDQYRIDHDSRGLLVALVKVLRQCGGLSLRAEADALLVAGNYRPLDDAEAGRIAAAWTRPTDPAPATTGAAAPPFMAPPLPPQGLIGRDADLAGLFTLLDTADLATVALHGMGGIGKTALALAIGRDPRIADRFPDGVLWAALGPNPSVRPLLDRWGRALGVDLLALPDEAACQERLRSLLFHRRALLIVDDVWETRSGRALQVGGPASRLLLTTREKPIAHELATAAGTRPVGLLSPEAALALLRRLAPAAVAADEAGARRLCERLEFLPLALTLAGRYLADDADVPERLDRQMREMLVAPARRLALTQDEARTGLAEPPSLRAILGMSVARLDEVDQQRFAMLAVFGGEPLTWSLEAATRVWACPPEAAERTTAHLIQRGLIEHRPGRYWMHALLADYADELRERWSL